MNLKGEVMKHKLSKEAAASAQHSTSTGALTTEDMEKELRYGNYDSSYQPMWSHDLSDGAALELLTAWGKELFLVGVQFARDNSSNRHALDRHALNEAEKHLAKHGLPPVKIEVDE